MTQTSTVQTESQNWPENDEIILKNLSVSI